MRATEPQIQSETKGYVTGGAPVTPVVAVQMSFPRLTSRGATLGPYLNHPQTEHIREIADGSVSGGTSLMQIVDAIEQQLSGRLSRIDDREVIPLCRNVGLLLVGGAQLSRADMTIVGMRFCGQADSASPSRDIVSADKVNQYYVYGEDPARAAAAKAFSDNHVAGRDPGFLMRLAKEAIDAGIQNCGIQELGANRACGGQVFTAARHRGSRATVRVGGAGTAATGGLGGTPPLVDTG